MSPAEGEDHTPASEETSANPESSNADGHASEANESEDMLLDAEGSGAEDTVPEVPAPQPVPEVPAPQPMSIDPEVPGSKGAPSANVASTSGNDLYPCRAF